MKKSELQSLINECIGEVLNEGKATKKKLAIKEIKRIIAENELSEYDLEEIDVMGALKRAGDIGKQTLGISSSKDKEAASKSFDEANAKAKTDQSKNKAKWMERAKGYSYLGKFIINRNGELAFEGKDAAPKTIGGTQPGATGGN
jgi:uncharacterized protein YPO0396